MAINYQQILREMNRPQRKSGGAMKRMATSLCLLLAVGGAGYALWELGYAGRAWEEAHVLVSGFLNRGGAEASSRPGVTLDVQAANVSAAAAGSLRPPESAVRPLPAPEGPIDVALQSNARPSRTAAPAVPAATSAPVSLPSREPVQKTPEPSPARARPTASGPEMAVTPVLSDAKAQIRVIDQMLGDNNPAEAMRRVESLLATRLEADDAAEAGYRLGYAARLLRDEEKAEKSWKETAEKYPTLRGGRFSALALADTMYHHYAGDRAQVSYWDDIQQLYSRVIGADDAPFLPEEAKNAVKDKLNRLNDSLFFGSAPSSLARYHKVESGELLGAVANKYRVDYESIARINGVNPNRIRAGMDLKLIVGDVTVVVRKNMNNPGKGPTVTWFLDGRWAREYPACVGDGDKTPAGTYQLTSREREPSWTNPLNGQLLPNDHPDNILGSRWMAMKGMNTQGLGIHGTTVDDSIPGYTSAGCVRLLNHDVEELFSYARIGGKVTVIE